jgi:hypothetical protein
LATYNNIFMNDQYPIFLAMVKQTIANHYTVPFFNSLSGFPHQNPSPELYPLTLLGAVPAWLTGGLLTAVGSMAIIQLLFFLLGVSVVFLLVRKITSSTDWGLFGALLYALQPIAVSLNSFASWRGDAFTPILPALAVLCLLQVIEERYSAIKIAIYGLLTGVILGFASCVWSGGIYAVIAYIAVVVTLIIYKKTGSVKHTLALAVVLLCVGWAFFTVKYSNKFLGSSIQTPLSNIAQLMTSTSPIASSQNLFFYGFHISLFPINLFYAMLLVAGFVFSFYLVLICLLNFGVTYHDESEKTAFVAVTALLLTVLPFALWSSRWDSLFVLPMVVIAGAGIDTMNRYREHKRLTALPKGFLATVCISMNLLFLLVMLTTTNPNINQTPQYQATLQWVRNNTPANATFLTWEFSGGAIEAWANRTTYSDVFAPLSNPNYNFSRFMFARADNFTYLNAIKPDYLLIRANWYAPEGDWMSLEEEANLSVSYADLNGTNLGLFRSKPENITADNVSLSLIYDAPDNPSETLIYKVKP